jgi:hypothetical protein
MSDAPANKKIYHITHVRNLRQIVESGCLWSDAKRLAMNLDCAIVGMSSIKQRRLEDLEVDCHPGTNVGDYVPFYFCPRSIMLYILHRGNHPDLDYNEGQQPIVHLQADMETVVTWAETEGVRWAFSDRIAGTRIAGFYNSLDNLGEVNWKAVEATDFRDIVIKEGKQEEFLVFEAFPWALIEKVGVVNSDVAGAVSDAIAGVDHCPCVSVEPAWYY